MVPPSYPKFSATSSRSSSSGAMNGGSRSVGSDAAKFPYIDGRRVRHPTAASHNPRDRVCLTVAATNQLSPVASIRLVCWRRGDDHHRARAEPVLTSLTRAEMRIRSDIHVNSRARYCT